MYFSLKRTVYSDWSGFHWMHYSLGMVMVFIKLNRPKNNYETNNCRHRYKKKSHLNRYCPKKKDIRKSFDPPLTPQTFEQLTDDLAIAMDEEQVMLLGEVVIIKAPWYKRLWWRIKRPFH